MAEVSTSSTSSTAASEGANAAVAKAKERGFGASHEDFEEYGAVAGATAGAIVAGAVCTVYAAPLAPACAIAGGLIGGFVGKISIGIVFDVGEGVGMLFGGGKRRRPRYVSADEAFSKIYAAIERGEDPYVQPQIGAGLLAYRLIAPIEAGLAQSPRVAKGLELWTAIGSPEVHPAEIRVDMAVAIGHRVGVLAGRPFPLDAFGHMVPLAEMRLSEVERSYGEAARVYLLQVSAFLGDLAAHHQNGIPVTWVWPSMLEANLADVPLEKVQKTIALAVAAAPAVVATGPKSEADARAAAAAYGARGRAAAAKAKHDAWLAAPSYSAARDAAMARAAGEGALAAAEAREHAGHGAARMRAEALRAETAAAEAEAKKGGASPALILLGAGAVGAMMILTRRRGK